MELIFDPMPALGKLKWSWLIKLLGNFPKLQTLIIDEVFIVNRFFFAFGSTSIYF